jgi:hypothetical protein
MASHTSSLAFILYFCYTKSISACLRVSRLILRPVLIPSFFRHSLAYISSNVLEVNEELTPCAPNITAP